MEVLPVAETAVSMVLMVAPTEGMSRYTSAPCRPSVETSSVPRSILTSAPSVVMPLMVWSIGRAPMSQPPGMGTSARENSPSSTGAK